MIQGWGRSEALRAPLEVTSEGCCLQPMAAMFLFTLHPLFNSPLRKHTFSVNNSLDWKGILRFQGRRKAPPIQQQLQKWCEACCKESWCEMWSSLQFGQTLTYSGKFPVEALCQPGLLHQPGCLACWLMCQQSCYCFFNHFIGLRSDEKAPFPAAFPSFFVCLAMQTQVTAVTKLGMSLSGHCTQASVSWYALVMQFICSVQPGESCLFLNNYYKFLFTNYFLNISGHIFFLLPF